MLGCFDQSLCYFFKTSRLQLKTNIHPFIAGTMISSPDIDARFLEPEGWRWHHFTREGRKVRFGSVFPKDTVPNAIVVCLPGLSEFAEKYFEVARTCLEQNLAFWVIDWYGQGKSGRYLADPHKRHSSGFKDDVEDLEYFIRDYVIHSSVHPDVGRIPMALLAHSMGGNIGLQYFNSYPERFECGAFSAPMLGIKDVERIPLNGVISMVLHALISKSYVFGGKGWREELRDGDVRFSNDAKRSAVHNAWCLADPELQVGNMTFGWIYHAIKACNKAMAVRTEKKCVVASAGQEAFVSNSKIRRFCENNASIQHIHYEDAAHELMMEKDAVRDDFLQAFFVLIEKCIVQRPETLKPF